MKYLHRILLFAILFALANPVAAQFPKGKDRKKDELEALRNGPKVVKAFRAVVEKPSESTVRVLADGKEVALGAIVGADGWIITKWDHVKELGKITVQLKDGNQFDAQIVGVEAEYDLVMLKIDASELPTVQWRASTDAKVGKWVASVGVGEDPLAIGVVSVATRKLVPGDQPPKGDAGFLGIGLANGTGGAKITSIEGGSAAAKAKLKVNDLIYEAGGREILDADSLIRTIGRLKAGDKILLKVKRDDEDREITATLRRRVNPQETMGGPLSNRRGGFPFILQHDTVLKPAQVGGPLVDLDGKTVGINIARAGRTETYAIPAEKVQALLDDLKSGKLAPKETKARVEPAPTKNLEQILRVESRLDDNDKLDKDRPNMKPKRFIKVHEVKLIASVTYTIEMKSTDLDSYLILEDANAKQLAEDDDSGGDLNAKIVFTPAADGVYRIIATAFDSETTGNYTLTVRKQATSPKR